MPTRKSSIAKAVVKPEIASLEAYTPQPQPPKDHTAQVTSLCIGIIAIALAVFGIVANASFMATFGAPGSAAVVLSALGVVIEILALALPPWAAIVSARGDRHGARDTLDSKISALESSIATAPSIALADPGATVAADMMGWLSHGHVIPSVHDFQTLRIIILTLIPAFAGPLLGLAMRGNSRPFVFAGRA